MMHVNPSFPRVPSRIYGYSIAEVDSFIQDARTAFDTTYAPAVKLTSADIRSTTFSPEKGGYATKQVDAALDRLETSFAERERAVGIASGGEANWVRQSDHEAAVLSARFDRKDKQRFRRVRPLERGYSVKDVDRFSADVTAYLAEGKPLAVNFARSVAFRSQLNGYDEAQVDAALDAVVGLLLARGQS